MDLTVRMLPCLTSGEYAVLTLADGTYGVTVGKMGTITLSRTDALRLGVMLVRAAKMEQVVTETALLDPA